MAVPAARADHADDMKDQILGRDAGAELALDPDFHRLGTTQLERLGRQHMLHLAGTDPESQRADTAMRGGVRIAAHDRRAGKREALFRADDVDDPLFGRDRVDIANAEGGRVAPSGASRAVVGRL